jgi:hypothetical protein
MNPIFIILYAVIITLLLVIFFPRLRKANPRLLWISVIAGLAGLLIIIVLTFTR